MVCCLVIGSIGFIGEYSNRVRTPSLAHVIPRVVLVGPSKIAKSLEVASAKAGLLATSSNSSDLS